MSIVDIQQCMPTLDLAKQEGFNKYIDEVLVLTQKEEHAWSHRLMKLQQHYTVNYILVKRFAKNKAFVHYTTEEALAEIEKCMYLKPTRSGSFGDGVYCYFADRCCNSYGTIKLEFLYTGTYYECIYDPEGEKDAEESPEVLIVSDKVKLSSLKVKIEQTNLFI